MKILVTNDDGMQSEGLWALAVELQKRAQVVIVAPDRERSATSAAITLHQPLSLTRIIPKVAGFEAYSTNGTPSDSVILALATQADIGLIFSGVNNGINLGDDVLLSGTVGAALQGFLRGIPSIALSMVAGKDMHFEVAARFAGLLADKIINNPSLTAILLTVNLPNLPQNEIKGIEITKLAKINYNNIVKEEHDGTRKYYRILIGQHQVNSDVGTDAWAIEQDRISISPLKGEMSIAPSIPFIESLRFLPFQK